MYGWGEFRQPWVSGKAGYVLRGLYYLALPKPVEVGDVQVPDIL